MSAFDFPVLDFELPDSLAEREQETIVDAPIYTLDVETDPFQYGRVPRPFVCGLYDGDKFSYTWGKDCVPQMEEKILSLPPGLIYMHNGGKFDIYYFMRMIFGEKAFIVNRRIVRAKVRLPSGKHHEFRDSYAIMPFPLKDFDKGEIDYAKMERAVRNKHKTEILTYLKRDCESLHRLVSEFVMRFGPYLTIGSLAMKELRGVHEFEPLGPYADQDVRERYYYGGRVECFQKGIMPGPWKVYDVNSMFPAAMKHFEHPMEMPEAETVRIRKSTCFITAEGRNYGAFPQRTRDGLRFDIEDGTFHVTRHEWDAAERLGLFEPRKIRRCVNYRRRATLEEFVDKFYALRKKAKDSGDTFGAIFYKYILNSAYGKFAQNPEKYYEWAITGIDASAPASKGRPKKDGSKPVEWSRGLIAPDAEFPFCVWMRPSANHSRYNIAVGASITGAARAIMMEAIANADTPIYCDTDSLICRELNFGEVDPSKLGAWKLEHEGIDTAMIARRKLYALMKDGECVKMACKGVRFDAAQIERVCRGETVVYKRDAPTFKLDGSVGFIERRIAL